MDSLLWMFDFKCTCELLSIIALPRRTCPNENETPDMSHLAPEVVTSVAETKVSPTQTTNPRSACLGLHGGLKDWEPKP